MAYALVACTIPCLKPFMAVCNTGFGGTVSPKSKLSVGDSYGLSSIQKSRRDQRGWLSANAEPLMKHDPTHGQQMLRHDIVEHTTSIEHARPGEAQSLASNDSMQMIIRHEVEFDVRSERLDEEVMAGRSR